MFFNLVWRNAKKSRSENLIYFLTLTTAAASFYIVLALGNQDVIRFLGEIESDAVSRLLSTMMPAAYLSSLLFVFFLVVFANKYQLECRNRELGLYLIFGMKKKRLFLQLLAEGFITSILAFCGGIICGGFLSEISSLVTCRLIGQGILVHQPSFSIPAALLTAAGLLFIQAVTFSILGAKLFRQEIHTLLYGQMAQKQDTGSVHNGVKSLLIGTTALVLAYWIVLKHFFTAGGKLLILSVLLGIAGTLLFIRGVARLLSLLASSLKNKSTQGLYTFTLRQLQENIVNKFVSVGVASILMMLTIMLLADGSSSILSFGSQLTRTTSVYDFTVYGEDKAIEQALSTDDMKPYVAHLSRMETGSIQSSKDDTVPYLADWSVLRKQVVSLLPPDVKDPATQNATGYDTGTDVLPALNFLGIIETLKLPNLIPLSAYNRLLEASGETPISLYVSEAVIYLNPDFFSAEEVQDMTAMLDGMISNSKAENSSLFSLDGQPFRLISSVPMKGLTADEDIKIFSGLIVSDEVFNKLVRTETKIVHWSFCIPKDLSQRQGLIRSIMDASALLKPTGLLYESYLNNFGRQLFYIVEGSYTSLYMGFMFLIIACALLALQFLTQMQTTKNRYLTLSILGAKHEQIKKSIHTQVFLYFLLPLLLACGNAAIGLYAMQLHLHTSETSTGQAYPLLAVIACVVILVMAIFACAVARTANSEISKLSCKPNP